MRNAKGPELLPAARDGFLKMGTAWVNLGSHPHIVQCHEKDGANNQCSKRGEKQTKSTLNGGCYP